MKIIIKSKHSIIKKGGEKRMKYKVIFLTALISLATMVFFMTARAENVRNSKHNMITNTNILATGTTEVCVFCHTPHGSNTNAPEAAPLWNRNISTKTYIMYTSPNFDKIGAGLGPKGVSIACLSCHDGTVAFDALHNFPGSGNTDNIDFTNKGTTYVDTDNSFREDSPVTPFPNLGADLQNDHPISMEIPCGKDPQFAAICNSLDGPELSKGRISPLTRDKSLYPLPADKRDQLRAYPSVYGKAYIECASCHNPHVGKDESTRFLRLPSWDTTDMAYDSVDRNAGSLICLSCHEK